MSSSYDFSYVISQPDICWHDNKTIVLRKCDLKTLKWQPEYVSQCYKRFSTPNRECPDDLIELEIVGNKKLNYICLKISDKKQPFSDSDCYGSNYVLGSDPIVDLQIQKRLLFGYNITSFWMPLKRIEENKYNPLVIRLPGQDWNKLYEYYDSFLSDNNTHLADKHCAAAYMEVEKINKSSISTQQAMQIKMTHCNDDLHSVCVFTKHFVAKWGCPQNFGALSYRPSECYGITLGDGQKFPQDFRMLNVEEYFDKLNTLKIIFKKHNITANEYVEIKGTSNIDNSKWAVKPKNNQLKIVSSSKNLKGLCVEHVTSRKNVELVLRMDADLESLLLTVYNKFYIWSNDKSENSIHCFTNADYGELSTVKIDKIWENHSSTKTIFKLKINSDDPGQYWCEAHTIFNFTLVASPKVVAAKNKRGHAFAMQINIERQKESYTLSHNDMKRLSKIIKNNITDFHEKICEKIPELNNLVIHNVRVMDIVNISQSNVICLCHTTVSIKSSAVDNSIEESSEEENSAENEEGVRHDTAVRMQARDFLISLMLEWSPHLAKTVRSTEFCFPEDQWVLARIGQLATISKFCLQSNGLPFTRKCLGDFVGGAYWEEVSSATPDCITELPSQITENLYIMDITKAPKKEPEKAVKDIRKLLESNLKNIIPADLHYLAKIIGNTIKSIFKAQSGPANNLTTSNTPPTHNLSETTIEMVRIFNYLMEVKESVIRPSIVLNSTNILLDAFEYLIDQMALDTLEADTQWFDQTNTSASNQSYVLENLIEDNDKLVDIIDYADVGVVVNVATNFVVFVIDPLVANVTGVAIFRANLDSGEEFDDEGMLRGAFRNEYYRFILANQSVEALLNEESILMGTFVPTSLWQRLDEISLFSNRSAPIRRPDPKIVIKVYANDKLFQEDKETSDGIVYGKVISISIPGHDKDLPETLPLILTVIDTNSDNNDEKDQQHYCSYWNYQTWAKDGVSVLRRSELNNNTVLCGCTHLTPFAYLIGGSYNNSVDSEIEVIVKRIHEQALDIITLLGCSLSLFGIFGIFVTACTFRSWRQKANSKVLLQLSAAIALQMILFCFVNTEENSRHLISNEIFTSCIAIGACLHYSVLVQFCWMVIIAYLQFKRYVQVFGNTRPKRFFAKSTILGWGLPFIPVGLVLIFDSASYIPHQNESSNPICYPSGHSLYISIVLPVTLVIVANLVIFVVVIYNIVKNPSGAIRHTEKSLALSQIRLLVLLFFLLGFTWIFGLMTAMKAGLVFSYLFCLTATLQGFILFVYFIIMDPVTRRMWCGYLRRLCGLKVTLESSSSLKETTQSF